jgi:membrane protein implicated in regulation of membrane protease activity
MRWDVFAWAAFALVLFAAEAMLPGRLHALARLRGGGGVRSRCWLAAGLEVPLLAQVAAFIGAQLRVDPRLSQRGSAAASAQSDQPALNRRTAALVGRVVRAGPGDRRWRGRVQIAMRIWEVIGSGLAGMGSRVRIVGTAMP